MDAIVIGCGRMGDRHVSALKNLGIKVIGVCDTHIETSLSVASKHSIDTATSNVSEVLNLKPDIAVIATTAPSHKDLIIECLSSGIKKILCEKPLSTSISDCETIIEQAARSKADIAVNHQMRYMDQYIIPKNLLNSQEFGIVQSIHVTAGNFGMAMNGLHYIEMMRYMFDEEPYAINAWFDSDELQNPRGEQFKDKSGELRISTKSDKIFTLNARVSNGHGLIVTYVGKYGQIVVDELSGNMYYTVRKPEERALPTTRYGQPHIIENHKIQCVDIISSTESVLKDLIAGHNYPSLQDATCAIRALVAGYLSHENDNHTIMLDDARIDNSRVFQWA